MPFSNNSGGPWGDGGKDRNTGGGGRGPWGGGPGGPGGGRGPGGGGGNAPDMDELLRQGRERLKSVFGGGGAVAAAAPAACRKASAAAAGSCRPRGPRRLARRLPYTVENSEQSVELVFGEFSQIGQPGLNFAPWPFVTYEVLPVTRENVVNIGIRTTRAAPPGDRRRPDADNGDENIVDVDFQVVWNIAAPTGSCSTSPIRSRPSAPCPSPPCARSSASSEMKPILNRDRARDPRRCSPPSRRRSTATRSGVNVVRVNFDKADPPSR